MSQSRKTNLIRFPILKMYSIFALLFLFLPVIMLVLLSFNANTTGVFPLKGFTLRWYSEALESRILWPALENSLIIAFGTALVSAVIGTPAAFGLIRYNFPMKKALRWILTIPMSLPTLLIGVSLLSFFALLSLSRSLITVIIGHVVYCVPYMVLVVSARLTEFDFIVEEAALDLGATPMQTFRLVTFPLIRPTIIGAMMLIFAQSFDMFVISFFNIGAQSTLPMVIWSMMRIGINPSLNALGSMIMGVSILILILAHRFGGIRVGGV
ncbi:MAG: ABC transporter permease [Anaerolineaceae bacterium]|nr:ABC transporter permease [Anaerolineaceae bacterium]